MTVGSLGRRLFLLGKRQIWGGRLVGERLGELLSLIPDLIGCLG